MFDILKEEPRPDSKNAEYPQALANVLRSDDGRAVLLHILQYLGFGQPLPNNPQRVAEYNASLQIYRDCAIMPDAFYYLTNKLFEAQ